MDEVGWASLIRPVLTRLASAYDSGVTIVDPALYASELGTSSTSVTAAWVVESVMCG